MKYQVNEILPVIQGEGCNTGLPMVLIRLHGCSVGCPWCDTPQAQQGPTPRVMNDHEIARLLLYQHPTFRWVLVTGGEPAEQELFHLAGVLSRAGYKLALETNGTATGCIDIEWDWVCVSPKPHQPPRQSVMSLADEIKMVVSDMECVRFLDDLLQVSSLKPGCQICVQPMSQDKEATDLCVRVAMARQWRLSVQIHKYIDQP